MKHDNPPAGTRERLVAAMLGGLRTRGYHGVGLAELLASAQAPKGVLYHHFPGGKAELAVQAIDTVVADLGAELDTLFRRSADPAQALVAWMAAAQRVLEKSGFERGCPLATIALESTAEDADIRNALARGFATLRSRVSAVLAQAGMAEPKARGLAALIVSAYEGALLQARVAGSAQPMRDTAQALVGLLQISLGATPKGKGLKR